MNKYEFRSSNHFVSQFYLRGWTRCDGRLSAYRTLVSHDNVPLWKRCSPRGVARHDHLYTRLARGAISDELERKLCNEFETPAEIPLRKVISADRLSPEEWNHLIRLLALHDARTPAGLLRYLRWAHANEQKILEDSLQVAIHRLKQVAQGEELPSPEKVPYSEYLPIRVSRRPGNAPDDEVLSIETLVGRGGWQFGILRYLAGRPMEALLSHRWTILSPPVGMQWPTTDAPVAKVNIYPNGTHDLAGGVGSPGTVIIFPVSPRHLMFTQVGVRRPPQRGSQVPLRLAELLRRFIVKNAYRMVFANEEDPEIARIRRRQVDPVAFRQEEEQWRSWHEEQTDAELELRRRSKGINE